MEHKYQTMKAFIFLNTSVTSCGPFLLRTSTEDCGSEHEYRLSVMSDQHDAAQKQTKKKLIEDEDCHNHKHTELMQYRLRADTCPPPGTPSH